MSHITDSVRCSATQRPLTGTARASLSVALSERVARTGPPTRASATEFVFLVGIPTMVAASGYAFLELAVDGQLGRQPWLEVALAFAAATVTGFVVVKWLLGYIKSHRFTGFALYRIALGIALLVWLPGE